MPAFVAPPFLDSVPADSYFSVLHPLVFAYVVLLCGLGAFQGLLFARKKLFFGCPLCGTSAHATHSTRRYLWLDCPKCGALEVSLKPGKTRVRKYAP